MRFIPLLLLALVLAACGSPPVRPTAPPAHAAPPETGDALVVETAFSPGLPQLLARLRDQRLIYVGEVHDRNADHRLQLAVLRALPPDRVALGVEWFQARFQSALDDYIAGRIDEAEMLRRTEYFTRWRFDYRLYRPIIRYAREHHIPIIALNASRELTEAIRARGIAGLPPGLRDELPESYDFSDREYDRILRGVFSQHERKSQEFPRFREVQLTWDESMAQRIAAYLKAHPERQMVVMAGRGHVAGRHGIPNRVSRRSGIRGVVILRPVDDEPPRGQADYLVLSEERPLPPRGLIGALLDIADGRVVIKGFTPGSAGRAAGLREGDRIVAINGREVTDYTAFKLGMLGLGPGARLRLVVLRQNADGETRRHAVEVALKAPRDAGLHR
ncbi:ChaN family lipoprotein [endosymbiont of unidentified scaly snail isolate Monju]|uniref:ChaN family lipoprotein n=1 Tax=endosymbiont of unidentified scaly snail isolate Monju TaxID=1248727 RepID=UPI0003892C76|nr:ChaN family lipoprotein [endosymbiont of unidentified scaly snail isolate Monju]BAN69496.1 conserved hypothetical protein [endosymbiont of unidentified scaly snail isolate Monju]